MKKKRFSTDQIASILKEHEQGTSLDELIRKHGISIAVSLITIFSFIPGMGNSIDLSGYWAMTFDVKQSSLVRYVEGGLNYKYRIVLRQEGEIITGSGEKFWESFNGIETYYCVEQKTPINIEGKLNKRVFSASIIEKGKRRKTSGFIEFVIAKKSKERIEGVFRSTAANSKGEAILVKLDL